MPTIDQAHELAAFAYRGYAGSGAAGPITIVPARLNGEDVYLVGLSGFDLQRVGEDGQSVGAVSALTSGAGLTGRANQYVNGAVAAIAEAVPEGATLVFAGHSLGGMVGQQLAADLRVQDRYDVAHTVTFGSPVTGVASFGPFAWDLREGEVTRLGDDSDAVPYASNHTLGGAGAVRQVFGLNREDGGTSVFDVSGSHTQSYLREEVWGGRDALGERGGSNVIEFDEGDVRSYRIPALIERSGLPTADTGVAFADASAVTTTADVGVYDRAGALAERLAAAPPEERGALVAEAHALLDAAGQPDRKSVV